MSAQTNPYPVILPESLKLGHLVAALGTFVKATAWELGERFNSALAPKYGPDWLYDHFHDKYTPNLHDPDFVIQRHPQDSILWEALPPYSWDLQERFKRARWTRNRWEHAAAEQNMNSFINGVDQIKRLAEPLGLGTRDYAPELLARVKTLQISGGVLPPSDLELELERQRQEAQEARDAAAHAVRAATAAVADARAMGKVAEEAAQAKAEAEQQALHAEAEIRRLEDELRHAAKASRVALEEPADVLHAGQPWGDLPLGARTLSLKANMIDLMDQTTQTLLSEQVGEVAIQAAGKWLAFMPAGGRVHLTPAGHAAAYVGGQYIYLGRLDVDAEQAT